MTFNATFFVYNKKKNIKYKFNYINIKHSNNNLTRPNLLLGTIPLIAPLLEVLTVRGNELHLLGGNYIFPFLLNMYKSKITTAGGFATCCATIRYFVVYRIIHSSLYANIKIYLHISFQYILREIEFAVLYHILL